MLTLRDHAGAEAANGIVANRDCIIKVFFVTQDGPKDLLLKYAHFVVADKGGRLANEAILELAARLGAQAAGLGAFLPISMELRIFSSCRLSLGTV